MDDKEYEKIDIQLWNAIRAPNTQELQALLASPSGDMLRKRERNLIAHVVCQPFTVRLETLNVLVESGFPIDPTHTFSGHLILIYLAREGNQERIKWLLDHGYPIDVRSEYKSTALEIAYELGHDSTFELLRDRKAPGRLTPTLKLLRDVRKGDLSEVIAGLRAGALPWETGSQGETAYAVAFDLACNWIRDPHANYVLECLAAIVDHGPLPSEDIAIQVGSVGVLTGNKDLLHVYRRTLHSKDPSPTLFAKLSNAVVDLLRFVGPLDTRLTRDFAYNLLDMCFNPTEKNLEIAYQLVLDAEFGNIAAEFADHRHSFYARRRYARQVDDRESERQDPLSYVAHRGLIQQFFEAKQGGDHLRYADVPIYVATSRHCNPHCTGMDDFLQKATPGLPPPPLSFAAVSVAVPGFESHIGELPKPSRFRLFGRKNVERFIQVLSFEPLNSVQAMFNKAAKRRASAQSGVGKGKALVFVHGFNVTFEYAIERAAQLVAQIQYEGTPFCYSWPSHGTLREYLADEEEVDGAAVLLREFLETLLKEFGPENVHILAHSMGSRIVLKALHALTLPQGAPAAPVASRPFGEVVLSAADVREDIFCSSIPTAAGLAQRVTSYSSIHDRALKVSKELHKGDRAGLKKPPIGPSLCIPRIVHPPQAFDAIDVSAVDQGGLGHSYCFENPLVMFDIVDVLDGRTAQERKRLMAMNRGEYWEFPK
jgi:esterase/lipase superfamily enzyme